MAPLSKTLFHGSDHEFAPGQVVTPNPEDEGGAEVAYASTSQGYASDHGRYLYEVEPVNHKEMRETTKNQGGPNHAMKDTVRASVEGFKVRRRIK